MIIDTKKLEEAISGSLDNAVQTIDENIESHSEAMRQLTQVENLHIKYMGIINDVKQLAKEYLELKE